MSSDNLPTKTYSGEGAAGKVMAYAVTEGIDIQDLPEGYIWEDETCLNAEEILTKEDSQARLKISQLIKVLKSLKNTLDTNLVKVRLSDDRPISFLAKDNDNKVMASITPLNPDSLQYGRLDPIEANLLGYHVICNQREDCDWKGDRYRFIDDAKEASKDHEYFSGHECRINSYKNSEIYPPLPEKEVKDDEQ